MNMHITRGLAIYCILALLALGVFSCASGKTAEREGDKPGSATDTPVNKGGKALQDPVPAPDFSLKDQSGKSRALSDYKGKVVWVSFWATWCHACKMEMIFLEKIRKKLDAESFEVLSINIDSPDRKSVAMAQARALNVRSPILFDSDNSVINRYNPSMELPYAVLIDRQGRQRFIQRGFLASEHYDIENRINELIAE